MIEVLAEVFSEFGYLDHFHTYKLYMYYGPNQVLTRPPRTVLVGPRFSKDENESL
jgi:hypothetical protein